MTLSAVISAYNEEKHIEDCLKSVKDIADEIVVVDNSSTDNTATIAKKHTKNVFKRENNTMLNINKNYGISKARGEWVLVLDADERVTNSLAKEIIEVLKIKMDEGNNRLKIRNSVAVGYRIPRKNIIFGKWIQHTGWYPDYQTRLFRKGKGKFAEKDNHEQLTVDGEIGVLSSNLYHLNYEKVSQYLHKMITTYTDERAKSLLAQGHTFKHRDILASPVNEFLSRYFSREGYKDGFHGLVLALLQAFDHFVVALKMWEMQKFKELDEKATTHLLNEQIKTLKKEYYYWEIEKNIKRADPLKKAILKAKRKFA